MPDSNWKYGDCYAVPVGSHPETVTVGETRVIKIEGKVQEKREEEVVKYEDWSGRCRVCFP